MDAGEIVIMLFFCYLSFCAGTIVGAVRMNQMWEKTNDPTKFGKQ